MCFVEPLGSVCLLTLLLIALEPFYPEVSCEERGGELIIYEWKTRKIDSKTIVEEPVYKCAHFYGD